MASSDKPILCTGIAVQDLVFGVAQFPPPGGKCMTDQFTIVSGGCAVNAAIAMARLGGNVRYAGPLGDPGDNVSNQLVSQMEHEKVGTAGIQRIAGATAPVSGIMVDKAGERMIVTYRDPRIEAATPTDPAALVADIGLLLADNRFPDYVRPICEAASKRGIPVVLDGDRPTTMDDPLFKIPTHIIFSSECLRETTGERDLRKGLERMRPKTKAFLAVSDGPNAVHYFADGTFRTMPVFKVEVVDTLAAGDVFHAGFALGLAEGRDEVAAMRLGAAAAALKCTRFGGSMGAPTRREVDEFIARQAA